MFRPARRADCDLLSKLALRSKASWGYPPEFMEKCRGELTIDVNFLEQNMVEVIEIGGEISGFYSIERESADVAELGHLFVEPGLLRRGYGRQLLARAAQKALAAGFRMLRIQGDPNADAFYQSSGARRVGTQPSASIPGRQLPVYELALTRDPLAARAPGESQ